MRFLIFSDAHFSGKSPNKRTDNYYQSCLEKFDEILTLSKNVDAIISVGDFLDSPLISNTIIDDFLDRIEKNDKDFYVIYGNHELNGYNLNASKSSSLSHMIRRSKKVKHLQELEDDNMFIKGYDCYYGIEDKLIKDGLIHSSDKKFTIAFTHAYISIKPFFQNVSHICAKDLETNYSIIWCSHFHTDFDETINGTRFLNTNSIGRASINEQHLPKVAIIDTDTKNIKVITLKCAKPANEIFDLVKYDEVKDKKKDIKEFLDSLKNVDFQSMEIGQQIVQISKSEKIEEPITNHLLKTIDKVRNE